MTGARELRHRAPGGGRRKAWSAALLGLAVLLALACMGGGGEGPGGQGQGEGPGRRYQPLALTPAKELQLGEKAFQEVLQEYRGRLLPSDSEEVERVRGVSRRILQAAHIEPLEREINLHVNWNYIKPQFAVVKKPEVNAFCLPGCKVVVFTGLFRVVEDNDAYLATVLSHEIAHALAHHSSERLAREEGSGKSLGSLRFERWQESEADHIGVFLMTFAGYNPEEAVRFWSRMAQMTGTSRVPEILSDHPSDERRIRQMQGWARAAAAAKQAYDRGRIASEKGV
jgi:predicted Zn-dependent protease